MRARGANPDLLALISYYPDGAQLTRQIRQAGITQPIIAGGSIYSPKFLELGGDAVNGVLTTVPFFPDDPRPLVQNFVKSFEAKFGDEPDAYNGRAYDTFILLAAVMRQFGADRKAIKEGLGKIKDVPSVVYGKVAFDTDDAARRRSAGQPHRRSRTANGSPTRDAQAGDAVSDRPRSAPGSTTRSTASWSATSTRCSRSASR